VAKIDAFAQKHGLTVLRSSLTQRTVRLAGTADAFDSAFSVKLQRFKAKGLTYRGRTGAIYIPRELAGIVEGVHGLDNRPVARPHFRLRRHSAKKGTKAHASTASLSVAKLAELYNFPSNLTGKGQCIALIELNGFDGTTGEANATGYKASDIATYFKRAKIPQPQVASVGVAGGANLPGVSDDDGEVVLDIEVAGAAAPGAQIAVYFAPNTTDGFIDAVKAAIHDTVRRPSVISISWGDTEDPGGKMSPQFYKGLDEAFRDAAALGITVLVAAGDDGSADMAKGDWDGAPHADFPASSPFVVACGGTQVSTSGGAIAKEIVWNDGRSGGAGGGGISNFFTRPAYQSKSGVPKSAKGKRGRGLPDLAGNAASRSAYKIYLDGQSQTSWGTSAVAPLLAGLVARINQRLVSKGGKTAGFFLPLLYGLNPLPCRDVTVGDNDIEGNLSQTFSAASGWDACTGLGVPDGVKLLKALGG
jgi:kumamolisin